MRLLDWLLRRKREKAALSDEEAVRLALAELGRRHTERKKKGFFRRRHVDDFQELKIHNVKPEGLSDDLLYLTADTYRHRHLCGTDESPRVELQGAGGTDAEGASEAARASEEAKADFEKRGVKMSEHYYRAAERAQTGEIQETFEIDTGKRKRKGTPPPKP